MSHTISFFKTTNWWIYMRQTQYSRLRWPFKCFKRKLISHYVEFVTLNYTCNTLCLVLFTYIHFGSDEFLNNAILLTTNVAYFVCCLWETAWVHCVLWNILKTHESWSKIKVYWSRNKMNRKLCIWSLTVVIDRQNEFMQCELSVHDGALIKSCRS